MIRTFILLVLMAVSWTGLRVNGFCYSQARFLTEPEIVRVAFDFLNRPQKRNMMHVKGDGKTPLIWAKVPYPSFDDYRNSEPDCCQYGRRNLEQAPLTFLSRLCGVTHIASIKYVERWIDPFGKVHVEVEQPQL
jgi:hypothetical protein